MPHSPRTPHRRRPSSGLDLSLTPTSPGSSNYTSIRQSRSRKSSLQSLYTPTSPRPPSSHDRTGDFSFSGDYGISAGAGNGLGNLADELAEAWEEDGEEEESASEQPAEVGTQCNGHTREESTPQIGYHHDMGIIGLAISSEKPILRKKPNGSPAGRPRPWNRRKHTDNEDLDTSHIEETGLTPSMETRLTVIESLVRHGVAERVGEFDAVFSRVSSALKDLSSQANVESHTTRLATAHIALTSHLSHQTRVLYTLIHPILSPLSPSPTAEIIDLLLPLLSSLILARPQPPATALPSLHALHTSTTDLMTTLSFLSDNLHMMRQTTTLASRRLRVARETVVTFKRELEEAEEGVRWLEMGNWDRKIRERNAAKVCGEVVGGFEEVCRWWRERLAGQGREEVGIGVG